MDNTLHGQKIEARVNDTVQVKNVSSQHLKRRETGKNVFNNLTTLKIQLHWRQSADDPAVDLNPSITVRLTSCLTHLDLTIK